jgi:hypothetical protein
MGKAAILEAAIATIGLGDERSREIGLLLIEAHKATLLEPEIDQAEVAHDACCIWEWILERRLGRDDETPWLTALFEAHGSCAIRYALHSIVPKLEAAWQALGDERYDRVFDWEFVPEWCENHLGGELFQILEGAK